MRFTYVHFPKAGGTSIHSQLERQFPHQILYDWNHSPKAVAADREAAVLANDEWAGICGHFHAARYADRPNQLLFTVLREPVDNLISIYFFWKTFPSSGNAMHDRFLQEQPTLEQFAERYPLRHAMSQLYFGGFEMNRFDVIGFHETRHDDLAKLSTLLGCDLSGDVHANRTSEQFDAERAQMAADTALKGRLADLLRDDVRFYERLRAQRC